MIICEICKRECKSIRSLAAHMCKAHKEVNIQEYYDKYLLNGNEDKCKNPNCNNKNKRFRGMGVGYIESYCSYSCARGSEEVNNKQKQTCLEKYGDMNFRNNEQYMDTCMKKYGTVNALCKGTLPYQKKIDTCIELYGVENVFSNDDVIKKIREYNESNGRWLSEDKIKDYKDYYIVVKNATKRNINILLESWDGIDFYDNEYIKDNFKLDSNNDKYPSIDHKISIRDCFKNNIPIEICSGIDNLCITKRIINSKKGSLDYREFIIKKEGEI